MPGSKISKAPENKFCGFFYAFAIKEGTKEDYLEVRKRQRLDYRLVNKIMCFLEGGYFKGVLTEMCRNNGQGLLKAKINFLLKNYIPGA